VKTIFPHSIIKNISGRRENAETNVRDTGGKNPAALEYRLTLWGQSLRQCFAYVPEPGGKR
jgi:hypothetical protein